MNLLRRKCGVRSAECRVQSAECGVRSVECEVKNDLLSSVSCLLYPVSSFWSEVRSYKLSLPETRNLTPDTRHLFFNPKSKIQNPKSKILLSVFCLLVLSSCQPSANLDQTQKLPKVVSTSTIIGDLAEQVGGEEIEQIGILEPGADPHVYEPVPQDSIAFEQADLILYNGYNLEPGLIKLMKATGVEGKKVAVGEVIKPLSFQYQGQTEPDPHVWGDVENAIAMVNEIRDQLIALSPEDQDTFNQNAEQLIENLKQLDQWVTQQIATIPPEKRQLVTTHDAFQYYATAYNLKVIGTLIGISTEEQPSAKTVKQLADTIRQTGVPVIFAETTINPQLITTVAKEAGVKLAPNSLFSDSIGTLGSEGESYIKMMVANTKTIVEALGGKYQPFEPKI